MTECTVCMGGARALASQVVCMHRLTHTDEAGVIEAKAGSRPVGGVRMAAIRCRGNTKPVLQLSYIRICWSLSRGCWLYHPTNVPWPAGRSKAAEALIIT